MCVRVLVRIADRWVDGLSTRPSSDPQHLTSQHNTRNPPPKKQVALELGYSPANKSEGQLQLVSFHSISKGFLGECGLRGGMCG